MWRWRDRGRERLRHLPAAQVPGVRRRDPRHGRGGLPRQHPQHPHPPAQVGVQSSNKPKFISIDHRGKKSQGRTDNNKPELSYMLLLLSFDCCIFPVSSGRLSFADLLDKTERFVNILEGVQNIKYYCPQANLTRVSLPRGEGYGKMQNMELQKIKKISNNFQICSLQY